MGGRGRGDAPQERRDWNTGSLLPGQIPPAWPIGESVLALGWPALASPGRDVCFQPKAGIRVGIRRARRRMVAKWVYGAVR